MASRARHLVERLLPDGVPIRQLVLTLPWRLRLVTVVGRRVERRRGETRWYPRHQRWPRAMALCAGERRAIGLGATSGAAPQRGRVAVARLWGGRLEPLWSTVPAVASRSVCGRWSCVPRRGWRRVDRLWPRAKPPDPPSGAGDGGGRQASDEVWVLACSTFLRRRQMEEHAAWTASGPWVLIPVTGSDKGPSVRGPLGSQRGSQLGAGHRGHPGSTPGV